MRTEQPIMYSGQIETNDLSGPKTKVRFGELGSGEVFFFNNQRIVKTGESVAVSDRKVNKQLFLFFKKDVVKKEGDKTANDIIGSWSKENDGWYHRIFDRSADKTYFNGKEVKGKEVNDKTKKYGVFDDFNGFRAPWAIVKIVHTPKYTMPGYDPVPW